MKNRTLYDQLYKRRPLVKWSCYLANVQFSAFLKKKPRFCFTALIFLAD